MPARAPGEFEIIALFTRALPLAGRGVIVGPGDDAAVLRPAPGEDLVATVDAVVAGVHFDGRATPADVGWKALAVNLSDLAAMGARPVAALVALGLPRGTSAATVRAIARRQRRPSPRLAAGLALAGVVRAAIDVSDGLVQDLDHLCRASGVGARIGAADLPLSPAYRRLARRLPDPLAAALGGGEDYELVVAVPPAGLAAAQAAAARARTPLTVIGRFVRGSGVQVVGERGEPLAAPAGHDHLRRRGGRTSDRSGARLGSKPRAR